MKIRMACIVAILVIAFASSSAFADSFAQVVSTENQAADATPKVVTLNLDDALQGFENKNGAITVKQAGTYFMMAAGQVGGTGTGTVRLWMRQNGKDIDNSNAEQAVTAGSTSVLVCQGVGECKAGDKIELVMSATGANLGLVSTKPADEPAIPSMIFSALEVGGAYAQLCSTESQPAGEKGRLVALNQTDLAKGLENNKGVITVKEAGLYFLVAAGQAGATAKEGKGTVRLWMRQNGKDVDNSNTEQSVMNGSTAVLVCQGVTEFKAGDKLELMQSTTGKDVGLVATTPKGEPMVTSIAFSAFKVSGRSYAQLTSLKTQAAAGTGKALKLEQTNAAVGVENVDGVVTVKEAGNYFAFAAGQVGSTAAEGKGSVKLWMEQNGKPVENSNTEQTVASGSTSVVVCQGVLQLKAGDKLRVLQSTKGSNVGLVASAPTGEPTVPSLILSLVKIK